MNLFNYLEILVEGTSKDDYCKDIPVDPAVPVVLSMCRIPVRKPFELFRADMTTMIQCRSKKQQPVRNKYSLHLLLYYIYFCTQMSSVDR